MKKVLWIAVVALLANVTSILAQNNAYNMVIETTNGTKITLGQDDVKSISFNNGQLVISGAEVGNIMKSAAKEERDYFTKEEIFQILADFSTRNEVFDILSTLALPDMSDYFMRNEIFDLLQSFYTKAQIDDILNQYLVNYSTRDEVFELASVLQEQVEDLDARVTALENSDPTEVRAIVVGEQADGTLMVSGLAPNSTVQLFRVNGELLSTVAVMSDGTARINTSDLAAGIYIVRSESGSQKFIKK